MSKSFREQYENYWKNLDWHLASMLKNSHYALHWAMALKPKSILEVGAGTGRMSILLKRLLPETKVVVLDIDPEVCAGIRKSVEVSGTTIEVLEADLLSLPFPDGSFDLCHSEGVMEHFSAEKMLTGVREQLRVARAVIVTVPLLHWFAQRRSSQGDELMWHKLQWIYRLSKVGCILDFALLGEPLEELLIMVLMSNDETISIPLSEDLFIKVRIP